MVKNRSKIAHIFVLEAIEDSISADRIEVKPMFGSHSIYIDGKIICTLRHRPKSPQDNGIWLVMSGPHFKELKQEFPSLRYIDIFSDLSGDGFKSWVNLPEDGADFETEALRLSDLIGAEDPRIGKIPQSKLRTKKKAKKKTRQSR